MFEYDEPLFGEVWRRRDGSILPYTAQIPKDPGISDGAACDDEAIESGPFHQVDGFGGIENVTTSDDRCVWEAAFYFGQEVPVGFVTEALRDGSAVDDEGIDTVFYRACHNLPKVFQGLRFMVGADAQFHQDGGDDDIANGFEAIDDDFRFAEQCPASSGSQDFRCRTSEIQIDDVISSGHQVSGGFGHCRVVPAENLCADGVLIGGGSKAGLAQDAGIGGAFGEHHIGQGKRAAEPAGEHAHCVVTVSAEGGLEEGHVQRQAAEFESNRIRHIRFVARLFSFYVIPLIRKLPDILDWPGYCYIRFIFRQGRGKIFPACATAFRHAV